MSKPEAHIKLDTQIHLSANEEDRQKARFCVEHTDCPICSVRKLNVDFSMALIHCENCGVSFEYRFHRGIIPFHAILGKGKIK